MIGGKETGLRNLQDNFKHCNIWIIGVPEREEEEQEIENLFEKNNEEELPFIIQNNTHWKHALLELSEKLPQSDKGNRLPGSPGSSESPKEAGPKEEHTKVHHNYIT